MGHMILREDVGFKPFIVHEDGSKEFIEKDVQSRGSMENTLRIQTEHGKMQDISEASGNKGSIQKG